MKKIIILLILFTCSNEKTVQVKDTNERLITKEESQVYVKTMLTNYLTKNNIITDKPIKELDVKTIEKLILKNGYRIDWMPSGLTVYVYATPKNLAHPYNRQDNSLNADWITDYMIGSFCIFTNEN
jgi:hypothetical protein